MASAKITSRSDNPVPRKGAVWRFLVSVIVACSVVLILFTACGFFGRQWWRFEQLSHFRVQYFWLLTAAAAMLFVARRRRLGVAAVAAALINGVLIAPIYLPVDRPAPGGESLRLIAYNVLGRNQRHEEVLDFLRRQHADVVLLMEVQPHWANRIETLRNLYPHQHIVSRRDNFGIALLSKVAWRDVHTAEFGSSEVPTVIATFDLDRETWLFVGTHPVPPGSAGAAAARNEQLALIADFIKKQRSPTILAGDLNLTSFSPYFGDILRTCGLRDSRQGFGVRASWAPRLPLLDLPLDHCLVSREWHVVDRSVGPHLGSDHRPILVELCWAEKSDR